MPAEGTINEQNKLTIYQKIKYTFLRFLAQQKKYNSRPSEFKILPFTELKRA